MNAQLEQVLLEKLRALPPERRAEVEDFIDFLHGREIDRRLTNCATRMSVSAFKAVWDNPEDAVYDNV